MFCLYLGLTHTYTSIIVFTTKQYRKQYIHNAELTLPSGQVLVYATFRQHKLFTLGHIVLQSAIVAYLHMQRNSYLYFTSLLTICSISDFCESMWYLKNLESRYFCNVVQLHIWKELSVSYHNMCCARCTLAKSGPSFPTMSVSICL